MEPIIVIVGPTGVGKTKLSIALAKKFNAEIINADSMQVYQQFDIGTAKIREEEKENIPHHLFDFVKPDQNYTVYDYQKDCRKKIEEIQNRGKRVILVGGTGLYIKAALFQYEFEEDKVQEDYTSWTNEELFNAVLTYDSECEIHLHNRKRLIRALNKFRSGASKQTSGNQLLYPAIFLGLTTDRSLLYERINQRVDQMIEDGLEKEAKNIYDAYGVTKALMTGIGYKEWISFFQGEKSREEIMEQIKQNSRRYAKRQYTFFRNQFPMLYWLNVDFSRFSNTIEESIVKVSKMLEYDSNL